MEKENWSIPTDADIKDVIEAFGGWASDAPIVFELEAQKSMSHCLRTALKNETTD